MNGTIARWCMAGAMLLWAPMAWAEDLALIVANGAYRNYAADEGFADVTALRPRLERAGFRTVVMRDLSSDGLANAMAEVGRELLEAERVVVVVSGYFAQRQGRSWLLFTDANRPNGFTVGQQGLPVDALVDLIGGKPGRAILALAARAEAPVPGWRLGAGPALGDLPPGLTVVAGPPERLAEYLPDFLKPGETIGAVARAAPDGVRVLGFRPDGQTFQPSVAVALDGPAELEMWQRVTATDTVAGYDRYLRRYPRGRFAEEARMRMTALNLSPADKARIAEEALDLSRERRRKMQAYLTLLGFGTKGVDGVFGPNTRAAISNWQASIGALATGYLTGNQVSRIEMTGAARAEELERERKLRDRAAWERVEVSGGGEAALRAYLEEFPNGDFAAVAQADLDRIEREKRRLATEREREDWNRTQMLGTAEAYRGYLALYPDGLFAAEAKARLRRLSAIQIVPGLPGLVLPETPGNLTAEERLMLERGNGMPPELLRELLRILTQ